MRTHGLGFWVMGLLVLMQSQVFSAHGGRKHGKDPDAPRNWPVRDMGNARAVQCAVCVFITDACNNAKVKKDGKRSPIEDLLADEAVQTELRGFERIRVADDGSEGKGWPPDWLKRGKNGGALVLCSSDMAKVIVIDKSFSKEELQKAAEVVLKHEGEIKASAASKAKTEVAKTSPPPPDVQPSVPGLGPIQKAPVEKKARVDVVPENE